ncbi:MAG: hypothetical protein ACM3YF_01330, partial [Candidatus Zixiibacteriota bacterium]
MRKVTALFAGGSLILGFGWAAAADRPADAQLQKWQSEPGIMESTEDPRFRVPELTPGPPRPVRIRDNELPEVDRQNLKEIKKRQVPVSDNGARIILAPPSGAGRVAAPTLGLNFDGFNVFQSGYIPPDPVMAAGPNHLVIAVNLRWQIYSKTGAPGFFTTMQTWFSSVNTLNLNYSDPKVIYDPYAGRWMVMCIAFGSSTNPRGAYFVSVSDDDDPNGTWYKWMVPVTPNDLTFPDFPGVGYDAAEAFYFTANHFSNTTGQYRYSGILILRKSQLYANNPVVPPLTVSRINGMRDPSDNDLTFTIKPALAYGAPVSGGFLVNTQGSFGSNIELWRVNNPITAPALVHRATIPIGSYSAPPDASQPDDTNLINTNSSTIQSEVQYRDGKLYFSFPQAHNFGSGTVSAIRYLEIDTTGAIFQNIIYGADGEHFFFPANIVLNSGNAAMVYSHSSPASYCGARYVGNFPDDMVSGDLAAGQGPYAILGNGRNRWGDYGGIAQDPAEPRRVWMYHEYTGTGNIWRTRVGEIMLTNHAPQILGPSALTVNEGDTLVDTITVLEPDGENLSTFGLLTSLPQYASFTDLGGGQAELKLTPGCFDVSADTIVLMAADPATPSLADTLEIELSVLEKNCAPLAGRTGPDTMILNQCQTFSLGVFASDPDSSGSVSFSTALDP